MLFLAYAVAVVIAIYAVLIIRVVLMLRRLPKENVRAVTLVLSFWCPNDQLSKVYQARLDTVAKKCGNSEQIFIMAWEARKQPGGPLSRIGQLGKEYLIRNGIEPYRVNTYENVLDGTIFHDLGPYHYDMRPPPATDTASEIELMAFALSQRYVVKVGFEVVSDRLQLLRARITAGAYGYRIQPVYAPFAGGLSQAIAELIFLAYTIIDPKWQAPWCKRMRLSRLPETP